jgi:hypothetical protein
LDDFSEGHSDYYTFGWFNLRTIGLSDYRAFGQFEPSNKQPEGTSFLCGKRNGHQTRNSESYGVWNKRSNWVAHTCTLYMF